MLYNSTGIQMDNGIRTSVPGKDTVKIKNRLLNGKYHYMTIGLPVDEFDIEAYCNDANLARILDAEANVEKVRFIRGGVTYWGKIKEPPAVIVHNRGNPKIYIASFTFTIDGEAV